MDYTTTRSSNAGRLQRLLEYELSGSLLMLLQWFSGLIVFILAGAAIVFTPFMLYVLYQERRWGWILFFTFLVIIPTIAINIADFQQSYKIVLTLLPLALFYLYCFCLRLAMRDWDD